MGSRGKEVEEGPSRISDDDDHQELPGRNRARVSRACNRCRTRKDRCDGRQPQCSNCTSAGQSCVYAAASKKRGLPEGYVRGLEKLWAVMLLKVDGLESAVREVTNGQCAKELLRIWNHTKTGDDLHAVWKQSSILNDLDKLLNQIDYGGLKRKRDDDEDDDSHEAGLADIEALKTEFAITNGVQGKLPAGLPSTVTVQLDADSQQIDHHPIPLPSDVSNLLNQYFVFTHCWFPILDRPSLLRKLYEHKRNGANSQADGDSAEMACIWAVCAYSRQQTQHLGPVNGASPEPRASTMRRAALDLIPTENGPFKLGHIQALLILVLLDLGLGQWTSTWMLMGNAVRALLDVLDVTGPQGPPASHGLRSLNILQSQQWRAVSQGCFILDTLLSRHLARAPHLRSKHLQVMPPLDEDGHDEWEPWNHPAQSFYASRDPAFIRSCFNKLTELCSSINDYMEASTSQTAIAPKELIMSRIQALSSKYPFEIHEITQRPPHHLLVQACHFAFQAVATSTDFQLQQESRLGLIGTLQIFEESFDLKENCGIPSILAIWWPPAFNQDALAPLHLPDIHTTQAKFAAIWPVFESSQMSNEPPVAPSTSARGIVSPIATSSMSNMFAGVPSGPVAEPYAQQGPISPLGHNLERHPFTAVQQGNQMLQVGTRLPEQRPMNIVQYPNVFPVDSALPLETHQGSQGLATSPSFNGDEIDALFREMAQLDTTQWTSDRSQALKDYGFANDSTFEAFCNDPDRLLFSEGQLAPAFDNDASLASNGTTMPAAGASTQLGRMSFEEIFGRPHP